MAEETQRKLEPVKQIEIETKDQVLSSKAFIYIIIALLVYLIFLVFASENLLDKSLHYLVGAVGPVAYQGWP